MKNKKMVLLIAIAVALIVIVGGVIALNMAQVSEVKTTEVVTVTDEGVPAEQEAISEEEAVEIVEISGVITEITDEYVMIDAGEMGMIQANTSMDTLIEGVEELAVGQTAVILYDGKMTRSLPAQITAMHIGVYVVEGSVTAVEDEFVMILREDTEEEVMMTLPENAPELKEGDRVIAYTNGAMTMSLPPQMNAIAIVFAGEATPAEAQ